MLRPKSTGEFLDVGVATAGRRDGDGALGYHRYLLGMVGHELRNPLSVVSLAVQMLRGGGALSGPQRRALGRIEDAVKRMSRLVADLQDSTLLESGRGLSLCCRPTDMAVLSEEALGDARLLHPSRVIQGGGAGAGAGCWDPDRILQVLSNLLGNALKYSPPHSPVRLRWRGESDTVVVEVHNQGPPIPEELMPQLFDPFRRGGCAGRPAGLGLGLFIAQGIVAEHGGALEARSSEAEGTLFTLTLPRRLAAQLGPSSPHTRKETDMTTEQRIIVTETDFTRLQRMLDHQGSGRDADFVASLEAELARAEVVPAHAVPASVVTMHSTVVYEDEQTGARRQARLVYPAEVREGAECVSVLAPIGAALLGLSVGQSIDWPLPGGRVKSLRILEVPYQPEAAGHAGQKEVRPAPAPERLERAVAS